MPFRGRRRLVSGERWPPKSTPWEVKIWGEMYCLDHYHLVRFFLMMRRFYSLLTDELEAASLFTFKFVCLIL